VSDHGLTLRASSTGQLPLEIRAPSRDKPTEEPRKLEKHRGVLLSPVFDTYWRFAAERQAVYFRRFELETGPWTDDPILDRHRFTNAYRASDRVSQYLIRHVIYDQEREFGDIFFRVMLFKFFNRIDTWESLIEAFGDITFESFSLSKYCRLLSEKMAKRQRIYSAAYIMPAADRRKGMRKHQGHLELLVRMMKEDLPERIAECKTMAEAFELLSTYPMMGRFLAYQLITDLNYSPQLEFSETEFVMPGPGALDGIRKCFPALGDWKEADAIRFMADTQEMQFERLGISFPSLFGRPLQLIDCQNLFCEVDKYARVRHPDVQGVSGRSRIKQVFRPSGKMPAPWFPPKWRINDLIPAS
jgi:hypothetical protein